MRIRKAIVIVLTLALLLGSAAEVFAASSYGKASTITLEKFTGTVKISNASGKSVTARTGMRLYSGYSISTETNSNAYISLDSTKALMLESASEIKLKKSGNKIDIMLENGTVVTDISESLENDESMDIHTTNTVTGIRGTGVEVSYFGPIGATRICMLDGTTSNYNKFDDGLHVVSAGHGIEVGGGAATVEPIGDSIAVSDLQPETQRLMILDGGISEEVLEGFNESFGLDGISAEDKAELEAAVGIATEEKIEWDQAAEERYASEIDKILEDAEQKAAEDGYRTVDPVFEDQTTATGTGAVVEDETTGSQTATLPSDSSGSSSSGDSGSGSGDSGSGSQGSDETQTSDPVTVTVSKGDQFASLCVIMNEEEYWTDESDTDPATYTVTPEETIFWICYEEGSQNSGFTVNCTAAYVGSTKLDEVSKPSQYETSSGKFFAKSTLPESGGALTAELDMTLEKLPEDSSTNSYLYIIGRLDAIAASDVFTSATIHYDSRDAEALNEKMKIEKFTFVAYEGSGSSTDEISVTVPNLGNFFSVNVMEGTETLTGTQTSDGTVYTTSADSLKFALVPSFVNEAHYMISDLGFATTGVSNNMSGGMYDAIFEVTNPGTDYTFKLNIGIVLVDQGTGRIDSDQQNTITQVVTDMESSGLFNNKTLYIPEEMTQEDLTEFGIMISTVTVKNYYKIEFVDYAFPDANALQSYTYRDSIAKPDPEDQPDQSFVDGQQQLWDLTFNDWVRYDEPSDSYIPYDPQDEITAGAVYYARYLDRNTNELVVPYRDF